MKFAATILLLSLVAPAVRAGAEDAPSPPREEYKALLRQFQETGSEFRKAATDDERNAAVEHLSRFPRQLIDWAEKNHDEPSVVDALVELVRAVNAVDSLAQTSWDMNASSFPAPSIDDSLARAVVLLIRDHSTSSNISLICERMAYSIREENEKFLRAVLRTNPHSDVKGIACLSLAEIVKGRAQKLALVKERPELEKRCEGLFGKEFFDAMKLQGGARISKEAEALFGKAVTEHGSVKLPYGGTVGERAESELIEIRTLAVGKVAPEIEGADQEGKRFKLSDYRKKVVLLDFWSEL